MARLSNDELKAILKGIEKKHSTLTREAVVREAAATDHPLHPHIFGETAQEAAHQRRLDLAGELIRRVRVEFRIETRVISAPAYVHRPGTTAGYVSTEVVRKDRHQSHEVLVQEFRAAGQHLRRARDLAAYLDRVERTKVEQLVKDFDACFYSVELSPFGTA